MAIRRTMLALPFPMQRRCRERSPKKARADTNRSGADLVIGRRRMRSVFADCHTAVERICSGRERVSHRTMAATEGFKFADARCQPEGTSPAQRTISCAPGWRRRNTAQQASGRTSRIASWVPSRVVGWKLGSGTSSEWPPPVAPAESPQGGTEASPTSYTPSRA